MFRRTSMTDYPSNIDDSILALLEKDDVEAINIIYDLHYSSMIRIAYCILHDNEASKDIVQELFINVWVKRHKLLIKSPIVSYLSKSVVNRCLNYLRDNRIQRRTSLDLVEKIAMNAGPESLEYYDLKHITKLSIDSLSPRCKLIFNLSRSEEMDYNEISLHLGISKKAVEKQITKALKHLRHHLKSYLSASLCFVLI